MRSSTSLKPRFLFPNKAALSDTEVYVRLARGDSSEQVRLGTSISVGYMAENFVDFGFPGMLGGLFVIGLMYGVVIRYFMALKVPWILREGVVLAFVYGRGATRRGNVAAQDPRRHGDVRPSSTRCWRGSSSPRP